MDVSLPTQNGCALTTQEDNSSCCDKKKENQVKICLLISDPDAQWCHQVEVRILNSVCLQYVWSLDMCWHFPAFTSGIMESLALIYDVFTVLTSTVWCKRLKLYWKQYCSVDLLCHTFLQYSAILHSSLYFGISNKMQFKLLFISVSYKFLSDYY